MRILHIESGPNSGGQEYRTLEEVRWLNSNGHKAWIVCDPKSCIFQEALTASQPVIPLPMRKSLRAMWELFHIMRELRCDVLHTHGSIDTWLAIPIRMLGKSVVRTRHLTDPVRASFNRTFSYRYICNHLIVTAEYIRKNFSVNNGIPLEHMTVIGEGVDPGRFNRHVEGSSFRALWGAQPSDIVFGCVAMLRSKKGQSIFIEAAKHVLQQVPQARFVLIGDNSSRSPQGSDRRQYRQLIWEKFGYDGWRPENSIHLSRETPILMHGHEIDIAKATAALDVAVIPSFQEAQSRTAPEALCLGKPVIASQVGGLPEVVEHEKTGLLVPPKDPEALSAAMIRLAQDNILRKKLSMSAAEEGEKRFSFDARMIETLHVYKKVM